MITLTFGNVSGMPRKQTRGHNSCFIGSSTFIKTNLLIVYFIQKVVETKKATCLYYISRNNMCIIMP